MQPLPEPPWELYQFISFKTPLPPLIFIQEGWKEFDHDNIIVEKEKISNIDSLEEWELRKKITNPYEAIFSGSEDSSFPSLAKVQPLSRSYFKMIEILHTSKFWKLLQKTKPFISAHICEGPGGFLQHVVENVKEIDVPIKGIYAMTLKPTKTHIPGWRRSIGFLRKHPQIQLEYGADDTGNILIPANQNSFCEKAKGAQLFTADGGFDFSIDYSKQEESAFPLILASFTMGLRCLERGGTLVIKIFDMYSPLTQDLLIGTATFFNSFSIYKPATSRPCNSERYFIGKGYNDAASIWIKHLQAAQIKHAEAPLTRLIGGNWPSNILQALNEQIIWQENMQINSIKDTLYFKKSSIYERISKNMETSRNWCKTFGVKHR